MPYLEKSIKDLDISVSRRVVLSVVRSVLAHTSLEDKDAFKIAYAGDSEVELETGSYNNSPEEPNGVVYGNRGKLTIDVNEQTDLDNLLSTSYIRDNEQVFIEDKDLGLYIKPDYVMKNVTIEMTYRASTENAVREWSDNILRRLHTGFNYLPHEIEYTLLMEPMFMALLLEIYNKREAQAGYGESFKEWFESICIVPYTKLVKQDGTEPVLSFNQTASTVYGSFNSSDVPEPKRNESLSTYEINLSYEFQYLKPISFLMKYPLVVHNQVINPVWIDTKAHYDESKIAGYKSEVLRRFDALTHESPVAGKYEIINIPHFDDWNDEVGVDGMSLISRIMIKVDPNDLTKIADLKDLKVAKFTDEYLEQIRKYRSRITGNKLWLMYMCLYQDNIRLGDKEIYIDEDLVLRSIRPLNLRKTYRFLTYALSDFKMVGEQTLQVMREEPQWWFKHVVILDPSVIRRGLKPVLYGNGRFVTIESFERIINGINRYSLIDTRLLNRVCLLANHVIVKV